MVILALSGGKAKSVTMASKVDTLLSKLQRISERNIQDQAIGLMVKHEDKVIKLNQDQMLKGIRADGTSMGSLSTFYRITKQSRFPGAPGYVNLKYFGDFQDSMYIEDFGNYIRITSNDYKRNALVARYTGEIFGLTRENLLKMREVILPELRELIKQQMT